MNTMSKTSPSYTGKLRNKHIKVPEAIQACTGIKVFGQLLKSFVFSTDVAIIRNINANAIIAVYPFTPQPVISHAIILAADKPVFCGVGGGTTSGERCISLAVDAEHQGALGVVLNRPATNELVTRIKERIDIPVVITAVNERENFRDRIAAGVDIFNVSGAEKTADIVRRIRDISDTIPIIATGGRTDSTILAAIEAGANAISYTPPTTGELFKELMLRYRSMN